MSEYMNEHLSGELLILLDVLIALVLTGIIGWEREVGKKPAGLRTNMIVGAAAALLVSVGRVLVSTFHKGGYHEYMQYDPLRLIQAIVIGISFIGAGTILKSRKEEQVHNLTSAATILLSAGVGISVATHQYILATGLTILVYGVNKLLGQFERRFDKKGED
jgi:putative Mg2+ transporter-C (MgtC) family protein